jgi:hypothetical protein
MRLLRNLVSFRNKSCSENDIYDLSFRGTRFEGDAERGINQPRASSLRPIRPDSRLNLLDPLALDRHTPQSRLPRIPAATTSPPRPATAPSSTATASSASPPLPSPAAPRLRQRR